MMLSRKRVAGLTLLAGVVLWTACGSDDPTGPSAQPGQLTVEISTVGDEASAFLVTVTGDSISDPVAAQSGHEIFASIVEGKLHAAVIGTLGSGDLLKFSVPDVNQVDSYGVTLEEVAGSDNNLMSEGAFSLQITKE